ncbi:MAG: hypothetical protein EOM37_12915 [Proteobacteria bacterium]|nr:hypothetical protein [Pseudomonadota bacterium]
MNIKKRTPYVFFIILLLTTEFFYIEVFGGSLRIYHLLVPIVVIALYGYLPRVLNTWVFWILSAFLVINGIAASLAAFPDQAMTSVGLLAVNMGIALAVALILVSGRLTLRFLMKTVLGVGIISVLFGVLQIVAYHFAGINLALSESQDLQILAGFAPAFRTEANTFAKFLNAVFLLVLPTLLSSPRWKPSLMIIGILLLGMLISLTRSALYGLSVTLVLVYFWYLLQGKGRPIAPRPFLFLGLGAAALAIFAGMVGGFNEYAAHKLMTFFDSEEILAGGSSGFRLMSQGILWDSFLSSDKTIFFGNGWGQVKFLLGDRVMQAGGAEIIVALAYGGIFGGILYLLYQISAIQAAHRMATRCFKENAPVYEGVMFALWGLLITGQINGAMIAPEYWMMYGVAIYCGYAAKAHRALRLTEPIRKPRGSLL